MSEPKNILEEIRDAVANQDKEAVVKASQEAVSMGVDPAQAINEGLSAGMKKVGELWNAMELFMPEVMAAAQAYYEGLKIFRPLLPTLDTSSFIGTIVMGTIWGDVHTVGKDVAIPVFEGEGFKVIDLGIDVPAEKYIEAIKEHKADIVGLGTYMSETFLHTKVLVQELKDLGIRDKLLVVCGGPAVDYDVSRDMGADGAWNDAWKAAKAMKEMLVEKKN
jgi:methylmalonyl-CoA mutase cobalamin-binding domain/chain